ncbi:MAG: hypothetical protein A2268_07160 [Candidatus Raymondbacteria bacterium RifOxyA12_full_50_37]|uniref:Uncharacterized protein n=1 Tax=Candidatus Raymondbacteria bacterium RIFOXYD12_FULL_49_13 TaxID=1817890 RepID=A0A1F7FEZ7_UNCRA|nr:MAG: hypothetical protein A2350_11100 [Candidatus Raymondbacteria bacterium RifOxyB12_full_50_8]OGJ89753.1 MAG: hypothetical protein A2268_07160 [Candidatus Raymondbacteria bacterium RifOxyA12_full_50_37]OGJ91161.1 MAG: hypothetical protein A2248_01305 [Candidatus Raymondbacteria bacterium RIFOXYA2_FULL_49_16]OGJ96296.1 MAG: hypothetical protein A2487_00515 [Candidatus Raymondbacteria bacterium RifOxyC12_full_50_8]OGJ97559.1 MAG: hypothetical protein A2453_02070 [Candidatus Raymondbacteria b
MYFLSMTQANPSQSFQGSIFTLLAAIFRKHEVKPVLIGGYAFIASKVIRSTFDIDFIVTGEDEAKLEPDIISTGYTIKKRQGVAVQFKAEKKGLRDLDFLITDADTFQKLVKNGRQVIIAGETFIIPSPDHLIAMKLHAIVNNPEREKKDLLDVIQLIESNSIDPKSSEIKKLFKKYGLEHLFKQITMDK